jgi:hypothetical protein
MNCLAWNCRGLGNPHTIQELARLVRAQDPFCHVLDRNMAG